MSVAAYLNALGEDDARRELLRCCASQRWAAAMLAARPFADDLSLYATAETIWGGLGRADWLEAFAAHPRIGEDPERLRARIAEAAWSAAEQSGVAGASEETLRALAVGNRAYRARFGHVFLVCAAGKSAGEMLAILRVRLANDAPTELRIAAAEQAQITRRRLAKLVTTAPSHDAS